VAVRIPKDELTRLGDRAYDSDGLDERLRQERGIELIARHRSNRKRAKTQDGRRT
jgi:hypothetical protein